MKSFSLCARIAVITLALGLFTAPALAHADSYQIFLLLASSNTPFAFHSPVGITADGTVVASVEPTDCNGTPGHCYETFENGVLVSKSLTLPALAYDNGTPCTASIGGQLAAGACNNGRAVYGTPRNPDPYNSEIFTGTDPVADFFASGVLADVDLNSSGDFVYWVNAFGSSNGDIFEAIDLTTDQVPEPGSIVLLGTGILAALSFPRHRQKQN